MRQRPDRIRSTAFKRPHHNIDACDLVSCLDRWILAEAYGAHRSIEQLVFLFRQEMVVLGWIGIEIDLPSIGRDLAHHFGFGELMQGVVYRAPRKIAALASLCESD